MRLLILLLIAMPALAVPPEAAKYKRDLIRNARLEWGLAAPVATLGAQIEQESGWNVQARSAVGAQGLAQFMPATAAWISTINADLKANEPNNPAWALRAIAAYDKWLWDRVQADTDCDRMAFTLSGYNGGETRRDRERSMAEQAGKNPMLWWANVELFNAGRSVSNWNENRGYPRRILRTLEPQYVAAGWRGHMC